MGDEIIRRSDHEGGLYMKRGKKYLAALSKADLTKKYPVAEAVQVLRNLKWASFDESVNLDIRLGIDPRNSDQQVRGVVALPHGTGKKIRVAVFASGEKIKEAEQAGADIVGGEDLVKRVQEGFLDFDATISTPDMMRSVGKLGKVLGPRGMMPNPKAGTVTMDVARAIQEVKAGRVEYRVDKQAIVHNVIGKTSFTDKQLEENINSFLDAILKARPSSTKGQYIKSITMHSAMGAGIKLDESLLV